MPADTFPPPPPTSRQRWLVSALVLLFLVLSVQYAAKIMENRSAFLRWRPQVLDLEKGIDIYQRHNYPNPPIMALFLMPLAKVPPLAGALGWFYLKVGLTLLAMGWVFRLVEEPDRPFPWGAKVLTVLLGLRPVMGDLSHGNVNLLILFLVVAALYSFRRGRDLAAGGFLGLAVACKITPALFIPYFLWKRSWRVLAGCAAGLGLFLWPGLVPGALLGWERNQQLLASWAGQMVTPYLVEGQVTSEHQNQSLPGLIYRLTTESPSFSVYDPVLQRYVSNDYHNFTNLDRRLVRGLVVSCMLVFAAVATWVCRTPTDPRRNWRLAAEFSIVLVGMLLFCERTWKHHCVTLLVPFAVLTYYLVACRPGPKVRGYLIATLAAVALLMALTSTSLLDQAAKLAQVYGAYVWANLLLLAALVAVLRQPEVRLPPVLPYLAPARPFAWTPAPATLPCEGHNPSPRSAEALAGAAAAQLEEAGTDRRPGAEGVQGPGRQ